VSYVARDLLGILRRIVIGVIVGSMVTFLGFLWLYAYLSPAF